MSSPSSGRRMVPTLMSSVMVVTILLGNYKTISNNGDNHHLLSYNVAVWNSMDNKCHFHYWTFDGGDWVPWTTCSVAQHLNQTWCIWWLSCDIWTPMQALKTNPANHLYPEPDPSDSLLWLITCMGVHIILFQKYKGWRGGDKNGRTSMSEIFGLSILAFHTLINNGHRCVYRCKHNAW